MMSKLRVGVIGLGVGRQHIRCYTELENAELVALADPIESVVNEQARECGAKAYTDAHAMLEEEKLDAVSICTPPASHLECTQAAAAVGTHVLCEKPMAPSVDHCDGMIEACTSAGVHLTIGQKKRFHPLVIRAKEVAESDPIRWAVAKYALGRVEKEWFWQEDDGGGPLLENSIHTIDMLRHLMGEIVTVYAEGGNLFMPDFAPQMDAAAYTFRFENGSMAAVGSGMASEWEFANEHFYLACDRCEIRFHGSFDNPVHWWLGHREDPTNPEEDTIERHDSFMAEIEHFLGCVESGERPFVTGEDARGSVAACLAVKQSARSGQPVKM